MSENGLERRRRDGLDANGGLEKIKQLEAALDELGKLSEAEKMRIKK